MGERLTSWGRVSPDEVSEMKAKMTRSEAARIGGLARAKQFTRESQQDARRKVSSQSCRRNGSLGGKATIAKYGYAPIFHRLRRRRLKNPSQNELVMIGILAQLKIRNKREWRVGNSFFTIDFYLTGYRKAIEVNGRVHEIFKQEQQAEYQAKKIALLAEMGIEVLVINHTELADVPAVIEKIKQFVGRQSRQSAPAQTGTP